MQLITQLTDSRCSSLDSSKLSDLKQILKCNDELVGWAQGIIMEQLAANHSQASATGLLPTHAFIHSY